MAQVKTERAGLEQYQDSSGKSLFSDSGDVESDVITATEGLILDDPAFSLLANAWSHLSDEDRKAILAIVHKATQG